MGCKSERFVDNEAKIEDERGKMLD